MLRSSEKIPRLQRSESASVLCSSYVHFLSSWKEVEKTKNFETNNSKHNPSNILLICYCMQFSFIGVVPEYTKCVTFLTGLLTIVILYIFPALSWRYVNIYLVLSAFTSRPAMLQASNKDFVLQFVLFVFLSNKLTSSTDHNPFFILYWQGRLPFVRLWTSKR